jgi:hypothetical protein
MLSFDSVEWLRGAFFYSVDPLKPSLNCLIVQIYINTLTSILQSKFLDSIGTAEIRRDTEERIHYYSR